MAATIEQIAERAGVSTSTVARVLRGDVKGAHQRSAQRAKEILRISEELGYQPSWRARAFSRGKTNTIGLLYSEAIWIFEDPSNEIAIGFTEALQEKNYNLRLIPVSDSSNWKELVYGHAVDGLVYSHHVPELARDAIKDSGLPAVLLNEKDADISYVAPDDVAGGYMATRHLLGLGHKKIAMYRAERIRPHFSVEERQEGYEQAMREAGLAHEIQAWNFSTDQAIQRLMSGDAPTALVCYCHVEALHITRAAWTHGLAIPTDLSLIAFNDLELTQYMTPPLSVVGIDTADIGRRGAELLLQQIESSEVLPLQKVVLPEHLRIRGTTAPPSSKPANRPAALHSQNSRLRGPKRTTELAT